MSYDDDFVGHPEALFLSAHDRPRDEALALLRRGVADRLWEQAPRAWLAAVFNHKGLTDDDRRALCAQLVAVLTEGPLDANARAILRDGIHSIADIDTTELLLKSVVDWFVARAQSTDTQLAGHIVYQTHVSKATLPLIQWLLDRNASELLQHDFVVFEVLELGRVEKDYSILTRMIESLQSNHLSHAVHSGDTHRLWSALEAALEAGAPSSLLSRLFAAARVEVDADVKLLARSLLAENYPRSTTALVEALVRGTLADHQRQRVWKVLVGSKTPAVLPRFDESRLLYEAVGALDHLHHDDAPNREWVRYLVSELLRLEDPCGPRGERALNTLKELIRWNAIVIAGVGDALREWLPHRSGEDFRRCERALAGEGANAIHIAVLLLPRDRVPELEPPKLVESRLVPTPVHSSPKAPRSESRWVPTKRQPIESGQARLYFVTDGNGEFSGVHVKKVLKNVKRVERFRREIEHTKLLAAAGISVVPIFDFNIEGDKPFYVTKYYERGHLRTLLKARADDDALRFGVDRLDELYNILNAIHQAATAHRDLKPENILIETDDRLVLCDFGLCLDMDEPDARISESDEQIGSRHYIAPEGLAGSRNVQSPQALDYYALGKIAYELASGGPSLLGVQSPKGPLDLSNGKKGHAWSLYNSLVEGLVVHDFALRTEAWKKLPHLIGLVRRAMSAPEGDDAERWLNRFRVKLASDEQANEATRRAEKQQRLVEFKEQVFDSVLLAILKNERIAQLKTFADENPNVPFAVESGLTPGDWFYKFAVVENHSIMETLSIDELPYVRSRWRHLMTRPDVVLVGDARAVGEDSFALRLVLFELTEGEGYAVVAEPAPVVVDLGIARVGDPLFLAEVRVRADALANHWAEWLEQLVTAAP